MSKNPLFHTSLAVVLLGTVLLAGCGSASGGTPDPIASAQQVNDMVKAREIFDASDKNWDTLPADKKAEYTKLVGGDAAKAVNWWNNMKNPMGGPTGAPSAPTPPSGQ